jgi:hypothetical protein
VLASGREHGHATEKLVGRVAEPEVLEGSPTGRCRCTTCSARSARCAAGAQSLPPVVPREHVAAAAKLDAADHPIFAMRLAGTPSAEIAATLRITRSELSERTAAIVTRLARPQPRPEPRRRGGVPRGLGALRAA